MKAAVVSAPGKLALQEISRPKPGAYDCLVKIDACAICTGTDSSIAFGDFPWRSPYPFVIGHEATGIILETGPKVRNFAVGQRVVRPAGILPGVVVDGIHSTWGGYAEYGLVRDGWAAAEDGLTLDGVQGACRNPLPAGVDAVSGALSINQREILSVVRKLPLDARSRVAVVGTGYNGLLFTLFCKHYGAGRVVVLGSEWLRERARESFRADGYVDYRAPDAAQQALDLMGSPTHVIDAVGSFKSLATAEELLTVGTAFGAYGLDDVTKTEAIRQRLAQDRPAIDMAADEASCVEDWHRLWQAGFFAVPGMVDRVMPFEEMDQAFAILDRRQAVKIVLEMKG